MSDLEARLDAAVRAGHVPDELLAEARAEMQRRGLKEPAPELMDADVGDMQAAQRADEEAAAEEKANRLAALDAGEADTMFEAQRTGEADVNPANKLLGRLVGMDPATQAMLSLRANPKYLESRAAAGDEAARQQVGWHKLQTTAKGLGTSMVTGGALGPARGLLGAVAKGGTSAATGAAVESAEEGDDLKTTAKRAGTAALAGGLLNGLFHVPGALAARGQKALRDNPDIGRDIRTAEAGGYKTNFLKGLKPTKPTGREPGRAGVEAEAADLAPDAMKASDEADKALRALHNAADDAYFASEAGQKTVDSTPIVQEFAKLIRRRAADDGTPIPESAWGRLVEDAKFFGSKTIRVPIEQADEMAMKAGGVVLPRQLGPSSGPGGVPVTPGGRAMTPGNPPPGGEAIPAGPGSYKMPGPDTAMVPAAKPGQVGSPRPQPGKSTPVTPDGYTPPGAAGAGDDAKYATVLVPRQLNARELEDVRNTFDSAGNAANRATEDTTPFLTIADTARGLRKGFKGLDEMKTGQSSEVTTIKNLRKALGIPEGRRLNTEDVNELIAVGNALERYKAPGNLEADRVIDDFLVKNPGFKERFQKLAGMGAAERVRAGSGKVSPTHKAPGWLDWMLRNTVRLDPAMAALAKAKGGNASLTGVAGAEAADNEFLKQFITQRLKPQQQEAQ